MRLQQGSRSEKGAIIYIFFQQIWPNPRREAVLLQARSSRESNPIVKAKGICQQSIGFNPKGKSEKEKKKEKKGRKKKERKNLAGFVQLYVISLYLHFSNQFFLKKQEKKRERKEVKRKEERRKNEREKKRGEGEEEKETEYKEISIFLSFSLQVYFQKEGSEKDPQS